MSEEHEPWSPFGKGEGTFQLGIGERKTHIMRLEERSLGRSRVHWEPPEDTVRGCRGERGFRGVGQRATPSSPLLAVSPFRRLLAGVSALHAEGPGLRRFIRRFKSGVGIDWFHRGRAVDVQHGVELSGQNGVKVVTESLRFWLVNDADRALQARVGKS